MSDSHGKRLLSAAAILLIAAPTFALAQAGPPVSLFPGTSPKPSANATPPAAPPLAPTGPATVRFPGELPNAPASAAPTKTPPSSGKTTVTVSPLDAVDPEAVGVLSPSNGGLPVDLWSGSRRPLVEALLPELPVGVRSQAQQILTRRLLLSAAIPPAGPAGKDLLAMRVERLTEAGDTAAVRSLVGIAPKPLSEPLLRSEVEALLIDGEVDEACARAPDALRRFESAYWQKIQVFCHVVGKRQAEAQLGLMLLREIEPQEDTAFVELVRAMTAPTAAVAEQALRSLPSPTPLHLALLNAAALPVPTDVKTETPGLLRMIAHSSQATWPLRLAAAERAEAAGAMSTDELRALYETVPVEPKELEAAATIAASESGARARAVLWQAAKAEERPAQRVLLLAKAIDLGKARNAYFTTARVFAPLLAGLEPTRDRAFFAPVAVRALLAAGYVEAAKAWRQTLRNSGRETAAFAILFRIAGDHSVPLEERLPVAWVEGLSKEERTGAPTVLLLLEALEDPVPESAWDKLMTERLASDAMGSVQPARWRAFDQAVAKKRLGESLLLALVAMPRGPAGAHPVLLDRLIRGLVWQGLEGDARALALEAALAAGL